MERTSASWAATEFRSLDLGDKRLNRRAVLLA
ncbi:IS4/Tn5 family transposase DNA-binding protein, partial [Paraburkholderia aspalathi]